ncbi:MAG: iron-sulfur cluster co-chaperone HscB C-terminal domain-containing protein [Saprospiraceae bacterium]|nr:iron-sulfur cluster co-chaperone HscB C-terminal domain-containing protein [Saprospiraceae bacterium]
MDYFEHFGIPWSFCPDLSLVRKKYLTISRTAHPDLNVSEFDSEQKEDLTAYNNTAYATLNNEDKLFPYLLQLHGISLNDVPLAQSFLLEMMEFNEEVEDIKLHGSPEALVQAEDKIRLLQQQLRSSLQATLTKYEEGNKEEAITEVANYCLKINYLNRLLSNLQGKREL